MVEALFPSPCYQEIKGFFVSSSGCKRKNRRGVQLCQGRRHAGLRLENISCATSYYRATISPGPFDVHPMDKGGGGKFLQKSARLDNLSVHNFANHSILRAAGHSRPRTIAHQSDLLRPAIQSPHPCPRSPDPWRWRKEGTGRCTQSEHLAADYLPPRCSADAYPWQVRHPEHRRRAGPPQRPCAEPWRRPDGPQCAAAEIRLLRMDALLLFAAGSTDLDCGGSATNSHEKMRIDELS